MRWLSCRFRRRLVVTTAILCLIPIYVLLYMPRNNNEVTRLIVKDNLGMIGPSYAARETTTSGIVMNHLKIHSTLFRPARSNESLKSADRKRRAMFQHSETVHRLLKIQEFTSPVLNLHQKQVKEFGQWEQQKKPACNENFVLFPGHFVSLREVIFRKDLVWSKNVGGEDMKDVIGQAEDDEYYKINKGFFTTNCRESLSNFRLFDHKGHINKWLENTASSGDKSQTKDWSTVYVKNFFIIVKRYEYVNLYHTMTDFYSAFLVMKFFRKSPRETKILFFDTHPKGSLDQVWNTLFSSAYRVSKLQPVTRFRHCVWSMPGYDSPMYNYFNPSPIPLLNEFRHFFLKQYKIHEKKTLDCKRGLRLVVIWRRDYMAHPRNPLGRVERKIANEEELLDVADQTGFFSSVLGIQLDKLSMKRQLSVISSADILAGMHGAGLTHALFLPSYAGIIELFPLYASVLGHFEGIARWRNLHYLQWKNGDARNEMTEKRTRIPPDSFRELLASMKQKLCGRNG